jgi:DNA polymerase-1
LLTNQPFQFTYPNINKVLTIHYIDNDGLEAVKHLKTQQVTGFDTETTYAEGFEGDKMAGLDPHRSRVRLLQFATEEGDVYLFDNFKISAETKDALKDLLESVLPVKVAFHAKFDVKMVRKHLGVKRFGKLFDAEIGFRLTLCGQHPAKSSLLEVAREILSVELKKELQVSNWGGELSQEQLQYAALDAYILLPIRNNLIDTITSMGLATCAKLDFDIIDPMADMELTGFPLDPERWIAVDSIMKDRRLLMMEAIAEELRETGAVPQQGLFDGAPLGSGRASTSITSPKQIAEYLEAYGITLPKKKDKKTQKESKTTGSPWLAPLKNQFKIIPLLLEFRELDKRKSSYGDKFPSKYINPVTGRIHADYDPLGTVTARYSCNKPNLQNIPRLQDYRSCFHPTEGRVFVGGDFSQIELRIAAEFSGEKGYIDAFLSGHDFHDSTTALMFGLSLPPFKKDTPERKKWDKTEEGKLFNDRRSIAKNINFAILYGAGPGRVAMQSGLPVEETKKHLENYYAQFPDLIDYLESAAYSAVNTAKIKLWTGRLIKIWVNKKDSASRGFAERNGKNYPIQGGAGEILKIAIRLLFDRIYKAGMTDEIKIVNLVHDEIILECSDSHAELARELLETSMLEAGRILLKQVPCEVSVVTAEEWKK